MNLVEFLNSAAEEATGGLITASILGLVKKIKDVFKGKSITQETLDELIANNSEAKEVVMKLQDELAKANIINSADKIEIKYQFNNLTINSLNLS